MRRPPTPYLGQLRTQLHYGAKVYAEELRAGRFTIDGRQETAGRPDDYYNYFLNLIDDPNTKRMIFDARQAAVFDGISPDGLPEEMLGKLRLPFDQFYLELTEPIQLAEQEPGFPDDQLRAMLVYPISMHKYRSVTGEPLPPLVQITFFLTNDSLGTPQFSDRTFKLSLDHGVVYTTVQASTIGDHSSELPATWNEDDYFIAGDKLPDMSERRIGWWERTTSSYGMLLCWMLAYMMAKSIHIISEPVSRQVKRWHERRNLPLPQPWHLVEVMPKLWSGFSQQHDDEETDRHHRYRYDVIGHLRFGKHKRADGTYSRTFEFVPPHQRGLANTLYIPKTYKVSRGKQIAKEPMRDYLGTGAEKL